MGVNNRQRRAAKAKTKARTGRDHGQHRPLGDDHFASEAFTAGAVSLALRQLVLASVGRPPSTIDSGTFFGAAEHYQQHAVDEQLVDFVRTTFAHGWTPVDLYEAARRKLAPDIVEHLMSVVACETGRHPTNAVHPEWARQVDSLAATRGGGCARWASEVGRPWPAARRTLVDLLVLLCALPPLHPVLPAPGAAAATTAAASRVDERALRKVRALLAKAESTSFQDEADALTAKAQELMTRHAIERTLADAAEPAQRTPVVRRLWLDAPYTSAKSMLVGAVARSNHCSSVRIVGFDFVTLVGFERDLAGVELLSTSLLVQATRAMTASGVQVGRYGQSRTRSFRRSFLIAYATRIGERLRESAAGAESAADAESGGALVPVLAARDNAVADAVAAMFPELTHTRVSVSNAAGWGAGRAAADLARFDAYPGIGPVERAG